MFRADWFPLSSEGVKCEEIEELGQEFPKIKKQL